MSRLRAAVVLFGLFVLHITLFAHLRPFGVAPDVLMLAAVVGGKIGGYRFGARHGFWAGLLYDLMTPGPFGLAAGVYGTMGYGAGLVAEAFDPQDPRVGPAIAGVFSFLGVSLYGLGLGILGAEQFVEWRLVGVATVVAVVNAALTLAVRPAYRWVAAGVRSPARPESASTVVN